ncbi:homeodomain-like protein with RING/FYVE/PHD-type zinc finger domain-containing protein [Wolffia australiana]
MEPSITKEEDHQMKNHNTECQEDSETRSTNGPTENHVIVNKSNIRLSRHGKKVATRKGRTYPLRSSFSSSRVLRSESKSTPFTTPPPPSSETSVNVGKAKRKRRRKSQTEVTDECLLTKKRVRYLLNRMNYEQNLIDAYASEGWRGQSLEKIRPEMELQRAKSEIMRCKLKIRTLFQQLEILISEGKLDESLFDSKGQIGSEDIFCAKCKSKDVCTGNDIILCDGICDRGFHQNCLNPPLSSEDIPPGDEGWLCPACECKLDCIDLINEQRGANLSVEDSWEKVFPEAAFASSDGQRDNLELPSDDSEDDDYNPNDLEVENPDADNELEEESSSDESDFSASSEDLPTANHNAQEQILGLPSDDSQDEDYDPDPPEVDENSSKEVSKSDESDFSSDTDDLNEVRGEASDDNEAPAQPISDDPSERNGTCSLGPEIVEPEPGQRRRERMDYKKLYEETYGNRSDSSDDEDWSARRRSAKSSEANTTENGGQSEEKRNSSKRRRKSGEEQTIEKGKFEEAKESPSNRGKTPVSEQPDSNGKRVYSKFGAVVFQKLREFFNQNQYPSREAKEGLATELGMSLQQVDKWFQNARQNSKGSPGNRESKSSGRGRRGKIAEESHLQQSSGSRVLRRRGGSS